MTYSGVAGARRGLADLHMHTLASDGLIGPRELVDYVEARTELDLIAVTDHDETAAALVAREHAVRSGYRVQVIPGVEVTTREGHLLCLWLEERPPALRPVLATAEWVRAHGGLCVAPHPFTRWTHSLTLRALSAATREHLVAAVEVMNASLAGRASRPRALAFARAHGLAQLGSSDAHMVAMIGLGRTRFLGRAPAELRAAIENAATEPEGRFATPAELAAEAVPQLARSLLHLPARRVVRAVRGFLSEQRKQRAALR